MNRGTTPLQLPAARERDAWLRHMCAALDRLVGERDVHPAIEARMLDYFGMAADGMINAR